LGQITTVKNIEGTSIEHSLQLLFLQSAVEVITAEVHFTVGKWTTARRGFGV